MHSTSFCGNFTQFYCLVKNLHTTCRILDTPGGVYAAKVYMYMCMSLLLEGYEMSQATEPVFDS